MSFWIVSGVIAAAVAGILLRALLRGGTNRSQASFDMKVYRDQLAEVENDLARGVISEGEASRLKVEISRRILAADQADQGAELTAKPGNVAGGVAIVAALFAGAFALYSLIGVPGYPDLPISLRIERAEAFYKERLSQLDAVAEVDRPAAPEADPDYVALVERLREAVAQNPDDIQGLTLLARNEAALGDLTASASALNKITVVKGENATAADFAALADTYILATGGYVSPEAEAALNAALDRDPNNGTARFYMGLMWAQTGRPDLAFPLWSDLLQEGPENAPWMGPIRAQISMLAAAAGVDYTAPAELRGPDAADIAAAGDMTAEDRAAMIRGMVEQLGDRLANEGGSAEEWARLITALGVLGETERAQAIWAESRTVFAGQTGALAALEAAATQAGLTE
jgi:cytochrome c-type biogenesis protein CcmH